MQHAVAQVCGRSSKSISIRHALLRNERSLIIFLLVSKMALVSKKENKIGEKTQLKLRKNKIKKKRELSYSKIRKEKRLIAPEWRDTFVNKKNDSWKEELRNTQYQNGVSLHMSSGEKKLHVNTSVK